MDRYAIYALVCGAVYVVGFPLAIFAVLFRRRHKLFGSNDDPFVVTTRTKYGFLYEVRAPCIMILLSLIAGTAHDCAFHLA